MSDHAWDVAPTLTPRGRTELVLNVGHGNVVFDDHDHLIVTLAHILDRARTISTDRARVEAAAKAAAEKATS